MSITNWAIREARYSTTAVLRARAPCSATGEATAGEVWAPHPRAAPGLSQLEKAQAATKVQCKQK